MKKTMGFLDWKTVLIPVGVVAMLAYANWTKSSTPQTGEQKPVAYEDRPVCSLTEYNEPGSCRENPDAPYLATVPPKHQQSYEAAQSDGGPAFNQNATYRIDDRVRVTWPMLGCPDKDVFRKGVLFIYKKDTQAALRLFEQNGCIALDKGTVATVTDLGLISKDFCIRPAGEPDCLWFRQEWVTLDQHANP